MIWTSLLTWAITLPVWLTLHWFWRPKLRQRLGGGVRFLWATAVWQAPAWATVLIIMVRTDAHEDLSALLWRVPLAIGAAIGLWWILKRAPWSAGLYRDYDLAQRQLNCWPI